MLVEGIKNFVLSGVCACFVWKARGRVRVEGVRVEVESSGSKILCVSKVVSSCQRLCVSR